MNQGRYTSFDGSDEYHVGCSEVVTSKRSADPAYEQGVLCWFYACICVAGDTRVQDIIDLKWLVVWLHLDKMARRAAPDVAIRC